MTTKPPSDEVDASDTDLDAAAINTLLSAAEELATEGGPLTHDSVDTERVAQVVDRMAAALGGRFHRVDAPTAAPIDDLVASASTTAKPSAAITPATANHRIELPNVTLDLDEDDLADAEPMVHAWGHTDDEEVRVALEASPEGRHSAASADLDPAGARRLAAQLLASAAVVEEDGPSGYLAE